MTFYGSTATGAGLDRAEEIRREGRRRRASSKAPIGAGPYKFVSCTPGVELVLEAFDQYWRKKPTVKRAGDPQRSPTSDTRRADAQDAARSTSLFGPRRARARSCSDTPGLTRTSPSKHASCQWIEFPDQWDPKSPWHDMRVRQAASLAIDREGINKAVSLGFCPPTGVIVPRVCEFALAGPAVPVRPEEGEAAARRGRLPERLRRRPVPRDPRLSDGGRSGRQRSQRGRHPGQAARRWSGRPSTPTGRRTNSTVST